MTRIGLDSPKSEVVHNREEAIKALDQIGLPAIIRPSFTLGGTGGGIAYNRDEFVRHRAGRPRRLAGRRGAGRGVGARLERVRDGGRARQADNCIIICSIENVDPMGIHTGDSVTVAPALTLTDKEYQIMRNASIACLREIGVDTGGSNVQFAVDPATGRMVVIEMNPRVSRSSALASKATGFPIAKVAARLAVGYTLDELLNDITGTTPASFEPTIDYVVTKMPRFAFEKFPGAEAMLTTSMKSVGEAMSIGRTFQESLQKALRSMETGLTGLNEIEIKGAPDKSAIMGALSRPTPDRILVIAQAFRHGLSVEEVAQASKYEPWFLRQIEQLVEIEAGLRKDGLPKDAKALLELKKKGFSDDRLAELTNLSAAEVAKRAPRPGRAAGVQAHRHLRRRVRIAHALSLFLLRGRRPSAGAVRGAADRQAQDHHPGRRPEPHRPGHRVRLLLRARRLCALARPATRPSWSTATPRPCRPTTTPPTASTSSR